MRTFNANYWEDYSVYITNKRRKVAQAEKLLISKKKLQKKLKDKDSTIKGVAKHYAEEMRMNPSELEKKMMEFLDNQSVKYDFQRIFLIKNGNKHIDRFYIADFYIPSKSLIIETDGAFHDQQIKEDHFRTKDIQNHYPNIKVLRWRWHDFDSYVKMKELIARIK